MRSRIPLFALLFTIGSFALPFAAHAGIPFFGPIIPSGDAVCPAGFGLLITVINNIISFALTLAIVFVAPIMVAWAGFLYVVNSVNPGGIEKAKGILLNTVVGIVVALAGWMIVDALMAVLYNPTAVGATWSSIITGGDICLNQAGSTAGTGLNQATGTGGTPGVTAGGGTPITVTSFTSSGSTQPISLSTTQSDPAIQAGYTTANTYSAQINQACGGSTIPNCSTVVTALIAQESGGNPATGCNGSGACGLMQLTSGGVSCQSNDTACISNQITLGLQQLNNNYNNFHSVSDALAAYNSGATTQSGQSASGLNSAMVASTNCPGLYAWQCPINPGGLAETQGYVANICRDVVLHESACN